MTTTERVCVLCQQPFVARRVRQRYCLSVDCQRERYRLQQAAYVERIGRDAYNAYQRDRYKRNPLPQAEASRRSSIRVCAKCGAERRRADVSRDAYFLCQQCRSRVLTPRVHLHCEICDVVVERQNRRLRKAYCPDHRDSYTRYGKRWGITRERVRQLVAKEYRPGSGVTRLAILERLDAVRSVAV